MCVIFICETDRPSDDMVKKAFWANDSGAGVGWRENGKVKWEKGLDEDEIVDRAQRLPLPYVLHFRIPTVGGKVRDLCHPFPITKDASTALRGSTSGSLLFHNGHWHRWKDFLMDSIQRSGGQFKIPPGKWSDSRVMAWAAAHYGLGILEFIDEMVVAFGPDEIQVWGPRWSCVDNIWVSNRGWERAGTWKQVHGADSKEKGGAPAADTKAEDNYFQTAPHSISNQGVVPPGRLGPSSTIPRDGTTAPRTQPRQVGGPGAVVPFSMSDALRLREEGKLSKQALKKWRKIFNKREKAALKALMQEATSHLLDQQTMH